MYASERNEKRGEIEMADEAQLLSKALDGALSYNVVVRVAVVVSGQLGHHIALPALGVERQVAACQRQLSVVQTSVELFTLETWIDDRTNQIGESF